MFKNRFILIVGLLSVLLTTMAVSRPFSNRPTAVDNTLLSDYYARHAVVNLANDFYQRHSDWASINQKVGIPVTGSESLDYFQRHAELTASSATSLNMADYFARHPELSAAAVSTDLSDYFLRH